MYNSKNFHRLNKKLDPKRSTTELGKLFLNKSDQTQQKTENQCQNAACERKARREMEIWLKQKTRLK